MKEDILEQIVEEYLIHQGYFVRHNVKFRPNPKHAEFKTQTDSNHSDIDVIGYHPRKTEDEKVWVVSCKSWQGGFDIADQIRAIEGKKVRRGREAWKTFRELIVPKWSEAFLEKIWEETGERRFTYVIAVAKIIGDKSAWENQQSFRDAIGGNLIKIITFREMVINIQGELTNTLAATEVGRMLQMFRAGGMKVAKD